MQREHTLSQKIIYRSRLINGTPIYYGWIVAVVGTLSLIMTSPGQTYAVSIFIEHFIEDLGISRSVVSTLYSGGSLLAGFALPFIGRRIDRHGARVVMTTIVIILGIVCLYMGLVNNWIMLGFGFLGLRMFGQGGLSLVSVNVVNQWWVRRRGTVIGVSGLFVSMLGLAGFPILINWLIPIYGWRITYAILGLMLLAVMMPIALTFVRDRPEMYGLFPDGVNPETKSNKFDPAQIEENWTVAEVIRTPTFWIVAVGIASISMMATGLFFHMVSIFDDSGLSTSIAASAFVPIAVTTALVNLSSGVLVDRIAVKNMLSIALVFQAVALVMAPFLYTTQLAFLYGIILGATMGLIRTVSGVIWATYYGRLNLGSISGITTTIGVIGAALGPMPFGIGRDLLGSYTLVLLISATVPLLLGIANFFVGKPQK